MLLPEIERENLLTKKLLNYSYQIVEKIGKGGYATCYRVLSLQYNQNFVCKIMHIPASYGSAKKRTELITSYKLELKALTSMVHPNIVSIYRHFQDEDDLFLILEDCREGSLETILKRDKQIDPHHIIIYLKQIVNGLSCCHAHKIAHRDIKPANLLLHDGVVKLADFGLALEVTSNVEYLVGSLPFMAPEMFSKQPYDPIKTDIWALGVTIYLLSLGKYPFDFTNLTQFIHQITSAHLELPHSLHPAIQRLIRHTIVVDPSQRWSIEQIGLFLEHIPTPNTIATRKTRSVSQMSESPLKSYASRYFMRNGSKKLISNSKTNGSLPPLL